jgi:hypothetical protein
MEEVDMERLKAFAAGTLSELERIVFERQCQSNGYDPQILLEIWDFEQNSPGYSSRFDENNAFEQLKFKLNK